MTTTLTRAGQNGRGDGGAPLPSAMPRRTPERRLSWFARHPAWPISAYLIGYPVWWALGIADFMPVFLAVPMLWYMYQWRVRKDRKLRLPPGFLIWALFLIVAVAGIMTLGQQAPDTIVSTSSTRLISYGLRTADYLGCTVMLLYAGNLTESELSRKRLAWMMGLVGIYATIGGLCGILDPRFQFTAPLAALVPGSIQNNNGELQIVLHPGFSEVQSFLGYAEGRPKAPFDYTNTWGNCLAILLPWLIVVWWSMGTRKQKQMLAVVLFVAALSIVYSLDRGLWVGLACGFVYLAVRAAARGKLLMLASIGLIIALFGILIVASPLGSLIEQRLQHGKSDNVRDSLSIIAVQDAVASPFIGFGDTRHQQGSVNSIAVGKTSKCLACGSRDIGGNGQLWLLLICSGFIGTALYFGFFTYGVWRYRRDTTPYGLAAVLVILLGYVFAIVYQAIGFPLAATMLSYVILWKNEREMRAEALAEVEPEPDRRAIGGPGLRPITGQPTS
jgi:hypothetical protein